MGFNLQEMAQSIAAQTQHSGIHKTPLPRVELIRSDQPTQEIQALHKPALCLVVQGSKRVIVGKQTFEYNAAKYLAVSFNLPITGQVIEATEKKPYLCLKLDLDIRILSSLIADIDLQQVDAKHVGAGLMVGEATSNILNASERLIRLIDEPDDAAVLAPLIEKEILYRVLIGPCGGHLRGLVFGAGKSKQIAQAIAWIKKNYRKPFDMKAVADEACLSISALHNHFKSTTLMSPLQFQKHLRLQEARRLMAFEGLDASHASFEVGYESPSQFSREYRRVFGSPPSIDVSNLLKNDDFLEIYQGI